MVFTLSGLTESCHHLKLCLGSQATHWSSHPWLVTLLRCSQVEGTQTLGRADGEEEVDHRAGLPFGPTSPRQLWASLWDLGFSFSAAFSFSKPILSVLCLWRFSRRFWWSVAPFPSTVFLIAVFSLYGCLHTPQVKLADCGQHIYTKKRWIEVWAAVKHVWWVSSRTWVLLLHRWTLVSSLR